MTLSQLLLDTQARLGTDVKTKFTDAKKTSALNTVRKRIILEYNIQQLIKEEDISVTSGEGAFPTDYVRTAKELDNSNRKTSLWLTSDETERYERVSLERFQNIQTGSIWAIKEDTVGGTFLVYPSATDTYTLRYYYMPTNMSDPADVSGLPVHFDEVHPLLAARQLLFDDRQFDSAAQLQVEADKLLSAHFKNQRLDDGAKVRSSFQRAASLEPFIA